MEDRVAVITMNRPKRRNALSGGMLKGLAATLADVELAGDVGCVVLTGAAGAFCAGGVVKGMSERNESSGSGGGGGGSLDAAIHHQRLDQRSTAGRLWSMPNWCIMVV